MAKKSFSKKSPYYDGQGYLIHLKERKMLSTTLTAVVGR